MTQKSTTVTLIEDNTEYREIVSLALETQDDIELVAQFGSAEVAIQTLEKMSDDDKPDVVLLDLRLPGMDGLDAIEPLREQLPSAKIIVLTQSDQPPDILRAITLGASGYLLKSATVTELTDAIRTVASGGASLDSEVASFILESLQSKLSPPSGSGLLSRRELEILTLLAKGNVKKEIAKKLQIGYSTVDTHVSRIYVKLHVNNAPAAVNKAHRLGIFPPESNE